MRSWQTAEVFAGAEGRAEGAPWVEGVEGRLAGENAGVAGLMWLQLMLREAGA